MCSLYSTKLFLINDWYEYKIKRVGTRKIWFVISKSPFYQSPFYQSSIVMPFLCLPIPIDAAGQILFAGCCTDGLHPVDVHPSCLREREREPTPRPSMQLYGAIQTDPNFYRSFNRSMWVICKSQSRCEAISMLEKCVGGNWLPSRRVAAHTRVCSVL